MCGSLFDHIMRCCEAPDPTLQVYGFQVLEAWFNRAKHFLTSNCGDEALLAELRATLVPALDKTTELVLKSWEQPLKSLGRLLPAVFTKATERTLLATSCDGTGGR